MAMGDRERGLSALTEWYRASGLQYKGVSFEQVIRHYDGINPEYVAALGAQIRIGNASASDVSDAMNEVAGTYPGAIPRWYEFGNALVGSVGSFGVDDLGDVLRESASDVASVAKSGLAIYGLVIAAGILLFFWRAGGSVGSRAKA